MIYKVDAPFNRQTMLFSICIDTEFRYSPPMFNDSIGVDKALDVSFSPHV